MAAAPLQTTDRDHALERLRPADGVHGWNWSPGLVEPSGVLRGRARSRWRSTKGTHRRRPPLSRYGGVGTAGSALLRLGPPAACPTERGSATRSPPRRESRSTTWTTTLSQLQNIADGRGWIGLTYWNGGTAQVHPDGTAVDAAASGPLDTAYWGIELRCVAVSVHVAGKIELNQITVYASRGAGPEHHARCRPRQPVGPGRTRPVDLERAG